MAVSPSSFPPHFSVYGWAYTPSGPLAMGCGARPEVGGRQDLGRPQIQAIADPELQGPKQVVALTEYLLQRDLRKLAI